MTPPTEPTGLRELAMAVDAYQEATAGRGHEGTPHDRVLHEVSRHGDSCLETPRDDCSACAGAEYGIEDEMAQLARAALAGDPSPERVAVAHSYVHANRSDCYSYAECHRKAYG